MMTFEIKYLAKKNNEMVKGEIPGQQANPVILLFLMLSGSCGLVYEILWMKMLTLVIRQHGVFHHDRPDGLYGRSGPGELSGRPVY